MVVVYNPCNPKINVKHIFHGEINKSGKAVGFHHSVSIGHQGHARIVGITKAPDAQGVYEATVEIFDATSGKWILKSKPSTFFPDTWSRAQVLDEIRDAFNNQVYTNGPYWEGISPSGVRIGGWLDAAGNINTAYPQY